MSEEKVRVSGEQDRSSESTSQTLPVPATAAAPPAKPTLPAAVYIAVWIGLSSSVIIFNKWILHTKDFKFPITLTTWHLIFATIMTQSMAKFTTMLDSRKKVPMTGRVYLRAIVPIGVFFSLSLMFSNMTYIHLSVAFIQMLKATTPAATLVVTWVLGTAQPNIRTLGNIMVIVVGVIIASIGEIKFVLIGVVFCILGVAFEATRLAMVDRLLNGAEFKMDPMVSLYYFAPVCAVMNGTVALFLEVPSLSMAKIYDLGLMTLLANASVAFMLNLAVVFLIGKTSALVLTLSGVLKDILLVIASMVVFGDPVSGLQAFGYSIALVGLVYYKLGAEKIKGHLGDAQRSWAEYGSRAPVMRKIIIFGMVLLTLFVLVGGVGPSFGAQYDMTKWKGVLRETGN
ncbi:DMT family organic anion transporter [Microthyrium microscopicum]|uniref:DMT family organic anion transporter n=1 Tax=Microthyrium microscopicum TaxID=703497 RepID=A0A6A6UGW2_9PEZI|nr:DMT family organic anion transporter [Microthyrium microscopicum]